VTVEMHPCKTWADWSQRHINEGPPVLVENTRRYIKVDPIVKAV
jgi:hypothetical protein